MADYSFLPHINKDLWEKTKEKFKQSPKDIKELNEIFFKGKSPFFKEIDKNYKNEGVEFLQNYKYLKDLILNLESIPTKIPLLKKNTKSKKEFTRKECALIFLLSFFKLIDINQEKERETNNFRVYQVLLSSPTGPIFEFGRCFLNYLTIIGNWLSNNNPILEEKIKFIRDTKTPESIKIKKNSKLCEISLHEKGSLFNSDSSYYVDFANMFIGGGVLEGGCVQEEILFAIQPEAIVSMFFMEVMSDNDAIRIDNTIQYSTYSGYGHSFKFKGRAIDINNNVEPIKKYKIIAIDATVQHNRDEDIIERECIKRDIHKCFVGFNLVNFEENEKKGENTIATGNWGCGAFNGDHELKFLQQWVAASFVGIQKLEYYCYEAQEMKNIIEQLQTIKSKYKSANKLYNDLINNPLYNGNVVNILLDKSSCKIA